MFNFTTSLWQGLTLGLGHFMAGVPIVLGAILILLVGWALAGLIGKVATKFLSTVHADNIGDKIGVEGFLVKSGSKMKTSEFLGKIIVWCVRLVFVEMAAEQLGMMQIAILTGHLVAYIPIVFVALLIIGMGIFLSKIVSGVVRGLALEAKFSNPNLLAKIASMSVVLFAIVAAINVLGIAVVVVNTLFIGLVAALALAFGLSFGLGGKDTANTILSNLYGKYNNTDKKAQQYFSTIETYRPANTPPEPPVV